MAVPAVPLVVCLSLWGWSMDASTFPRISSTARPVPLGRDAENPRRKDGGCIEEPGAYFLLSRGYEQEFVFILADSQFDYIYLQLN